MNKERRVGAVIVAAGSGLRFGERKQFKKLGNKPLYLYSLETMLKCESINEIVLVVPKDLKNSISKEVDQIDEQICIVEGGNLRQDSVLYGINSLISNCDMVCIHDAARPFVSVQLIEKAIRECKKYDGVVVALPSNDTVKEIIGKNNQIKRTIPRDTIWLAQTPQVFNRRKLIDALSYAKDNGITVTDESTLLETLKHEIVVVEGNTNNFKITTREDWKFAELILEKTND